MISKVALNFFPQRLSVWTNCRQVDRRTIIVVPDFVNCLPVSERL